MGEKEEDPERRSTWNEGRFLERESGLLGLFVVGGRISRYSGASWLPVLLEIL